MIDITCIITANNEIVIDNNISINSENLNSYRIVYKFNKKWDTSLKLYGVFKPTRDVPIYIPLDENNSCRIPSQTYFKYKWLGIGLLGILVNGNEIQYRQVTNIYKIPVKISGGYMSGDLII